MIRRSAPEIRRRRSPWGLMFFGVFTLAMLGLIAGLTYFLLFGPGEVAITSQDGGLTISTVPKPAAGGVTSRQPQPVTEQAAPVRRPAPRRPDLVMGSLGGDVSPPLTPQPSPMQPEAMPGDAAQPDAGVSEMEAPAMTSEQPKQSAAAPQGPSDQQLAAAGAALERTGQAILAAQWDQMKAIAQATSGMPMSESQKSQAEGLEELADLATFYRGGIQRGVRGLQVGNEFEVTDGFRVVVVEVSEDSLIVRYNAKNRPFRFDELPLSLAHKLASLAIDEGPTREAAKAVYQAIVPNSNEGYRDEAVATLRRLDGQVEGTDCVRLAELIGKLFAVTP